MAEFSSELQEKLLELNRELEEGDITKKGYDKRRSQLLSQFLGSNCLDIPGPSTQHHSTENSKYPDISTISQKLLPNLPTQPENSPLNTHLYTSISRSSVGQFVPSDVGSSLSPVPYTGTSFRCLSLHDSSSEYYERQLSVRNPSPTGYSDDSSSILSPKCPQNPPPISTCQDPGEYSSPIPFNPNNAFQSNLNDPHPNCRLSAMLESQQSYFSDFSGQQQTDPAECYNGPTYYGTPGDNYTIMIPALPSQINFPGSIGFGAPPIECMAPLEPREIPFKLYDPHDNNIPMSKFDNVGAILRHRGRENSRQTAYWVLDQRGKEVGHITWDKVWSRAEKIGQLIRVKSNLYRGDRVALIYRSVEVIEFAIALLGCFLAGVVAVPLNNIDNYQKLSMLLTTTQTTLVLTTDHNLKSFHRGIAAQRLKWPTGVEWWKTNELGMYHGKRKDENDTEPPGSEIAYIEYSRAPTGDLRGVVLSHRTIMHQMALIQAILSSIPTDDSTTPNDANLHLKHGSAGPFLSLSQPLQRAGEVILSYLDPRSGPGLILTTLFAVYGGHSVVWIEPTTVEMAGLYAHLITKYRATVLLADYSGLKHAAYNYQQDPMATRNFKKSYEPNFGALKICFIDCLSLDCEFHEILADRWFKPMRNSRAREVVAPMLCLPEHGGMIISVRDWLGGEDRMGCSLEPPLVQSGVNGSGKKGCGTSETADNVNKDKGNDNPGIVTPGYKSLIGGGFSETASKKPKDERLRRGGELSEILVDKEALKTNRIVVLAVGKEEVSRVASTQANSLRVGAFGYPIADATLALVDPETYVLCGPNTVGEIWVDSPSLSGGFWALPKHTELIFHARPYRYFPGEGHPRILEMEFLRTGLLGCIVQGKVYVLGLYEDRIRQKVGRETGRDDMSYMSERLNCEYRFFFVQHLVTSIMKRVARIYDCSAFDSYVNGEYLPIILIETQAASILPTMAGGPPRQVDIGFLDSLAERVMEILLVEHRLRVYCVMTSAPNTLPRIIKNGRREIGNMLCRREFDNGSLACVHVKFNIEGAVQGLSMGDDVIGGIWSVASSNARAELLSLQDKQYSGVDIRDVVIDDRTSTPLNQFSNIHDLLQMRVSKQGDEIAYCTIDGKGRENKGISWRKFDQKVAAVANYLKNTVKVRRGENILLMYTHGEDFVFAVHACFCLGIIAIPLPPIDQNRLNEDAPAILHLIGDFGIRIMLVNGEVDMMMKGKGVSQHLKHTAIILRVNLPAMYNTSKLAKQTQGCRESGFAMSPVWVQKGNLAMIQVYWTPDQRRVAVQIGHDTMMAVCKIQKETCQMTCTRPIVGSVRSTNGLGFVYTCLMGIFLGAFFLPSRFTGNTTYLVSPVDFAQNPIIIFQTISRYKIKDTYATGQMLDFAMARNFMDGKNGTVISNPSYTMSGKGSIGSISISTTGTAVGPAKSSSSTSSNCQSLALHELKNLMISTEGRARRDLYKRVRIHFAGIGLPSTSINTIYSHVLNPMITSRSYMCIEPVELSLNMESLRRGLIVADDVTQSYRGMGKNGEYDDDDELDGELLAEVAAKMDWIQATSAATAASAVATRSTKRIKSTNHRLILQDAGMVPVSTQICIVNPETRRLCHVGEFGEIWVSCEANSMGYYASKDEEFDGEKMCARTVDGDTNAVYARTGDLGFLHTINRPIGINGSMVEMQVLFLLGSIGETFEVNGLHHFPVDIERSVEQCHKNIVPGGCAVFQAGELVVVLVEIYRKNYLASIVPVIVNTILNQHEFIVDIVTFVGKGDFPRSRLGEKQRGKILGNWIGRKLRTIAQFSIRCPLKSSSSQEAATA